MNRPCLIVDVDVDVDVIVVVDVEKEFQTLLTGHADKQSAIQAINNVGLFQYLEKPWDNQQLLLVVQAAIERASLLRNLREKITELDAAHSSLKDVQRRLLQAFL